MAFSLPLASAPAPRSQIWDRGAAELGRYELAIVRVQKVPAWNTHQVCMTWAGRLRYLPLTIRIREVARESFLPDGRGGVAMKAGVASRQMIHRIPPFWSKIWTVRSAGIALRAYRQR